MCKAALKSCVISRLSGRQTHDSNCEVDYPNSVPNVDSGSDTYICYPVLYLPEDSEMEYFESSLCSFEQQPVVYYVSGYLAARVFTKFNCECCDFFGRGQPRYGKSSLLHYIFMH
ncbi:uncharacterized protein LOC126964465 [Leptidea sinapis]|uniref:uncharacterized protein LOC126964465 n=1 Tax=Leptidea sinapis TaxID=189913 RepID=UPI0021C2670E|nr:uncharacterized protein LOC126964465 [Leptidea sinapis]